MGLSQIEAAARAGLSASSFKAYEGGRRNPSRPRLIAILDALDVNQTDRNAILFAAGFAIEPNRVLPEPSTRNMPLSRAAEEIHRYRWPAFVVNERMEIVDANAAGRRLWRLDPTAPGAAHVERNALALATDPEVASHVVNWDEAVSTLIAAWKASFGDEDLDQPSGYFAQMLDRLTSGDPALVERTMSLWERTPAAYPADYRAAYPVIWDEPPFGQMRFQCFAWAVNTIDGVDIDDWIPADADSWLVLERVMRGEG
jgi:transcriptional regulator with XRE-family HTH domain